VSRDSIHSLNVCSKQASNMSGKFDVNEALSKGVGDVEMLRN